MEALEKIDVIMQSQAGQWHCLLYHIHNSYCSLLVCRLAFKSRSFTVVLFVSGVNAAKLSTLRKAVNATATETKQLHSMEVSLCV